MKVINNQELHEQFVEDIEAHGFRFITVTDGAECYSLKSKKLKADVVCCKCNTVRNWTYVAKQKYCSECKRCEKNIGKKKSNNKEVINKEVVNKEKSEVSDDDDITFFLEGNNDESKDEDSIFYTLQRGKLYVRNISHNVTNNYESKHKHGFKAVVKNGKTAWYDCIDCNRSYFPREYEELRVMRQGMCTCAVKPFNPFITHIRNRLEGHKIIEDYFLGYKVAGRDQYCDLMIDNRVCIKIVDPTHVNFTCETIDDIILMCTKYNVIFIDSMSLSTRSGDTFEQQLYNIVDNIKELLLPEHERESHVLYDTTQSYEHLTNKHCLYLLNKFRKLYDLDSYLDIDNYYEGFAAELKRFYEAAMNQVTFFK